MRPENYPVIELRAGDLRLAVRPDLGGSIAGLWHLRTPLMRSTEPGQLDSARLSACFPLVPYSNRLGNRRFRWAGRDHTTAPNFSGSPHSLHGVGWTRPWEPVMTTPSTLVLRYRHASDEHWPFDFEATQTISLEPSQLHIELTAISTCPHVQPMGLGWHPYFPKREHSHLQVGLAARWDTDSTLLPSHKLVQSGIDATVSSLDLDHCFEGWAGRATIRDELFNLRLSSSLPYLVIYTPRDKDYFCVEPVSHVNNAVQMPEPTQHGLISLEQGHTAAAWMKLDITPA